MIVLYILVPNIAPFNAKIDSYDKMENSEDFKYIN